MFRLRARRDGIVAVHTDGRLMEYADVSFTNQQRSVTAREQRNYWGSADAVAHN